MSRAAAAAGQPPAGVLLVDKPGGWTSHDVVARVRRLAGTRRVGHAGTLDPMATGLLVIGIGRATRLLGHLTAADKEYTGTIRLGASTTTDDAEGKVLTGSSATAPLPSWDRAAAEAAIRALTGPIEQVPPAFSAISVDGRRSYARARAGETLTLAPRRVEVTEFELIGVSGNDLDVRVVCSAGTYIRALARDVGAALAVGGHLAALRRTRIGPFHVAQASTLEHLATQLSPLSLAAAVALAFPRREVDAEQAAGLLHGRALASAGTGTGSGPVGVFDPDGRVLALVEDRDGAARPLCVFG